MTTTKPHRRLPRYAIRVKHRHEKSVARSLEAKGYEHFLPLYQGRRRVFSRRAAAELPLLPGYVFCRLEIAARLPVLMVPGVIAALQSLVSSGLDALPWPFLRKGQRVSLVEGPLCGLNGLLVSAANKLKLLVCVTLLQRSVAVEIERHWVQPVLLPPKAIAGMRDEARAGALLPVACT